MSGFNQPAGWYPAQGDPPGTVRWWDGAQWVGGPQQQGLQQQAGFVTPGSATLANGRELADPWLRIAAALIDGVLVNGFGFVAGLLLGGGTLFFNGGFDGSEGVDFTFSEIFLATAVVAVVVTTYHTVMNTMFSGGVGKLLLGLRIVRADGTEPLGTPDGIKRSGNHLVDLLVLIPLVGVFVLPLVQGLLNLISLVFLFSDPEHRTVMDRFADTYVVTKQD